MAYATNDRAAPSYPQGEKRLRAEIANAIHLDTVDACDDLIGRIDAVISRIEGQLAEYELREIRQETDDDGLEWYRRAYAALSFLRLGRDRVISVARRHVATRERQLGLEERSLAMKEKSAETSALAVQIANEKEWRKLELAEMQERRLAAKDAARQCARSLELSKPVVQRDQSVEDAAVEAFAKARRKNEREKLFISLIAERNLISSPLFNELWREVKEAIPGLSDGDR